jgi:hypothetical protein
MRATEETAKTMLSAPAPASLADDRERERDRNERIADGRRRSSKATEVETSARLQRAESFPQRRATTTRSPQRLNASVIASETCTSLVGRTLRWRDTSREPTDS